MVKTFTKSELLVLRDIGSGNGDVVSISENLKRTKSQIYRILKELADKELITKKKTGYTLTKAKPAFLLNNLLKNPKIPEFLAGSQILILINLLEKSTIKEICNKTKLGSTFVTKFVKTAYYASILIKEKREYQINQYVYPELYEFLKEYQIFYYSYDKRIPVNSTIYFKNEKEIVFSTKEKLDNATLTSFSAFKDYNLLIYTLENFYYFPKKELTKQEILKHTLAIVDKTKEFRDILYLALFYYKYKAGFKDINHEILDNLNKIFSGEKIDRYPPLKEIKEKARIYDINM
jgi:predicted transcriptional regulator